MKYYDELSKLESCLIEMDKAKALSKAVVTFIETEDPRSELIPLIYLLDDLIQKGLKDANCTFQKVWNAVALDNTETHEDFEPVQPSINIHPPLWDEQEYPYNPSK